MLFLKYPRDFAKHIQTDICLRVSVELLDKLTDIVDNVIPATQHKTKKLKKKKKEVKHELAVNVSVKHNRILFCNDNNCYLCFNILRIH